MESLIIKAKNDYMSFQKKKTVSGKLIDSGMKIEERDIFFLATGKNIEIIKLSLISYQKSFSFKPPIFLINLFKYEYFLFYIALILDKIGLKNLANRLNYYTVKKIYNNFMTYIASMIEREIMQGGDP
ncbi:MAG: DUF3189 family protein [Bacillota bacterium]